MPQVRQTFWPLSFATFCKIITTGEILKRLSISSSLRMKSRDFADPLIFARYIQEIDVVVTAGDHAPKGMNTFKLTNDLF